MKKKSFNEILKIDDADKKIIEMIEANPDITHSDHPGFRHESLLRPPSGESAPLGPVDQSCGIPFVHRGMRVAPVSVHSAGVEPAPRLAALPFFRQPRCRQFKRLVLIAVCPSNEGVGYLGLVSRYLYGAKGKTCSACIA